MLTAQVIAVSCQAANTYLFLEHRTHDTGGSAVLAHWAEVDTTYGGTGLVDNTVLVDSTPSTSSFADAAIYPGDSFEFNLQSSASSDFPVLITVATGSNGALSVTIAASATNYPTATPAPTTIQPTHAPTTAAEACGSECCDGFEASGDTWTRYSPKEANSCCNSACTSH